MMLISMLWNREAIFKSKGDKLSFSAECGIWTQGLRHQIASRLNARWQTDWAIEDQAKNIHVCWFDVLALARDFRIDRRQVVFLCWMQDSNTEGVWNRISSRLNARWQTDWAIEDQAIKLELDSPSLISEHSVHIHTCLFLLISMLGHRQAIFESKGDKLSSSAECRIRTHRVSGTESPADWMPADKPTELLRIKLKTWTQQPLPMISEHSAHSTPLPFGIRTWLWRYTCLLLLISMLWHRQAIFKSKGDRLSSYAECRIRTQRVSGTESPTDWMPADKPTEPLRVKLKTWFQQPLPMISEHSAHSTPQPFGIRTWLWRYTCLLLLISMLWHRQAIFKSKGDKLSSSAECRIRTWRSQTPLRQQT